MPVRLLFALVLIISMPLSAAEPPRLDEVRPLAGTAGQSQEIILSGARADGATALYFSHPGIQATAIKKSQWKVEIATEVPPGDYDVWALGAAGLSNPRRFTVSAWPEVLEDPKNDSLATAQQLAVPSAVSGSIDPGADRDHFRVSLAAGQQVTIHCRSSSLDGTLLPALTVWGPRGEELLHDDGRYAEPVLSLTARQAGDYVVRIEESAYRKGAGNFYRLAISDRPRLMAAVPQVLVRGQTQQVALFSDRGDSRVVEIAAPDVPINAGGKARSANSLFVDCFAYRHPKLDGSVCLAIVDQPPLIEQEEFADSLADSHKLTLPATIVGRFLKRADVDWFRLEAKKGQTLSIEAVADSALRPLDLEVVLHDRNAQPLKTLTDAVQPKGIPARLPLASLDPQGDFKPTADGVVYLSVRDLYGPSVAGADRSYRLEIGPPREQAAVVAMHDNEAAPHGLGVAAGGKAKLSLIAVRRGGHRQPLRVKANGLPPGVTAKEVVIDGKSSAASMTFEAAADTAAWLGAIELTAETELHGQPQTLRVQYATAVRSGPNAPVRMTEVLPLAVLRGKAGN